VNARGGLAALRLRAQAGGTSAHPCRGAGPLHADQLRTKDPYEISTGHVIRCLPTDGDSGWTITAGVRALTSDPAVEEVGVDVGYSPTRQTLHAPGISIGDVPDRPGGVTRVPSLVVECAGTHQDDDGLEAKICELLAAGTRVIYLVRLIVRILDAFIERHAPAPSPDEMDSLRRVYVQRGVEGAVERALT